MLEPPEISAKALLFHPPVNMYDLSLVRTEILDSQTVQKSLIGRHLLKGGLQYTSTF